MGYRDTAFECCCVLAWSEKARRAYAEALREYRRHGAPGIPIGATDYRRHFIRPKPLPLPSRMPHSADPGPQT